MYGSADTMSADDGHDKLINYLQDFGRTTHATRHSSGAQASKSSKAAKAKKSKASSKSTGAVTAPDQAAPRRMVVIVLDEVDRLLTARAGLDKMVKLFMLPHTPGASMRVTSSSLVIDQPSADTHAV